ncbi:MAG: plasmid mobilization relaxosome protein MobC [Clostridia bacterium]|nr:plasmid mobilization relaxosome protein MobC [Clostridia bacterium]
MPTREKKTVYYGFKASATEDTAIRSKMQTMGITNKSAYIRAMALNGYVLKLDQPAFRKAVRLIGYLGNNVNQIARRMHERGSIYETEMDEIVEKQDEILKTLKQILSKLDFLNG